NTAVWAWALSVMVSVAVAPGTVSAVAPPGTLKLVSLTSVKSGRIRKSPRWKLLIVLCAADAIADAPSWLLAPSSVVLVLPNLSVAIAPVVRESPPAEGLKRRLVFGLLMSIRAVPAAEMRISPTNELGPAGVGAISRVAPLSTVMVPV